MSTNEKKIIASGACEENIKWELDDEGTLNIYGTGKLLSLASPSEWKSIKDKIKKVIIGDVITQIGEIEDSDKGIFGNCKALVSVTIPESVQIIGNCTFVNCIALKDIVIPDSVKIIGKKAFNNCIALTDITLPKGLTIIEDDLFSGCKSLKNIKMPDGITEIGNFAFEFCSSLTEIVIPEKVEIIGFAAFQFCSSLTGIVIPENVWKIGSGAFHECKYLSDITVTSGTIYIGHQAFTSNTEWFNNQPEGVVYLNNSVLDYKGGMPKNTNLILKPDIIGICERAFMKQTNLDSVVIPFGTFYIEDKAFYQCSSLKKIILPNSIDFIGECVFDDCKNAEIYYDGTKAEWDEIDKDICNCDIVVHCIDGDVSYKCEK